MGYSAEDVARLLGVSLRQVNDYVRAGCLAPARDDDGRARFSFQDVLLLRTATGLVGDDIAPAQVKRALRKLREQLPAGQPLSGVSIAAEGNRIVVREGERRWNAESGQALLDFDGHGHKAAMRAERAEAQGHAQAQGQAQAHGQAQAPARAQAAPGGTMMEFRPRPVPAAPPRPSESALSGRAEEDLERGDDWYLVGCTREDDGDRDGAVAAYKRALAADAAHVDAHVNLGRLLHERGDTGPAVQHYQRALELRPGDAVAAFNLGVALEDQERLGEAVDAYLQAVSGNPRSADAHYNLAGVYERMGDRAGAIRHLRAYKQLTRR